MSNQRKQLERALAIAAWKFLAGVILGALTILIIRFFYE